MEAGTTNYGRSALPPPVVAIAASAGGIEALRGFVSSLPDGLTAAVAVVMHVSPTGPSVLPKILGRAGKLPALHPEDGQALLAGSILVAPPDKHMVVEDGVVRLLLDARVNGHRPSADVLLSSVARDFGSRGAGVILSGTMDDGAAGLRAIRVAGGLALVQDPDEATFPGMPQAAIEESAPHLVAPVAVLARRLCEWLADLPGRPVREAELEEQGTMHNDLPAVDVTPLTCPECAGSLSLHDELGAERFGAE